MKNPGKILLIIAVCANVYLGCKGPTPPTTKVLGPVPEELISLDSADSMVHRFGVYYGRTRTADKISRAAIDAILADSNVTEIVFKRGKDASGNEWSLAFGNYSDSAPDTVVKVYKLAYQIPCRCRPCCGDTAIIPPSDMELCPADSI
jgi:hypothetical protein